VKRRIKGDVRKRQPWLRLERRVPKNKIKRLVNKKRRRSNYHKLIQTKKLMFQSQIQSPSQKIQQLIKLIKW
jgi:hypothetical protein